ncbi:MAG: rod shape-determining protein RodA, partial [Balneolaceae bacterium]|nr:rod shape-determining protein RodA [Balneolaceae bacterium]
ALSLALLVAVLLVGVEIKGATSWFSFAGFSFQPSELAKFGTCLAMASYLSSYRTDLKKVSSQLIAFSLMAAPMVLILLQPDAGSAIVFTSFLIVLYREGLPGSYYAIGFFLAFSLLFGLLFPPELVIFAFIAICLVALALQFKARLYWLFGALVVVFAALASLRYGYLLEAVIASFGIFLLTSIYLQWRGKGSINTLLYTGLVVGSIVVYGSNYAFHNLLKPHQQDRLNVWLHPEQADPRGSLYNVLQSKMAIGSGGLQGKGFLKGTMTNLNYVPEQSTDFIFCTIGEEQGFIGSFAVIVLFLLLLLRITVIAERQRLTFARIFAYSVGGILFLHFFINIGMTIGITPIIGIPLPFISKGGSAMIGFTLMLAVLLRLDGDRYRI